MSKTVNGTITTARNWTTDHNVCCASDIVSVVFTCVKIAWHRIGYMLEQVLTTVTTIWRPRQTELSLASAGD